MNVQVTVASEAAVMPLSPLVVEVPLFVPPEQLADTKLQSDDGSVSVTVVAEALLIGTVTELSTDVVLP